MAASEGRNIYEAARRRFRRRAAAALLALLALFFLFLSLGSTSLRLISPAQTVGNLSLAVRLALGKYLGWSVYGQRLELIRNAPAYLETMTRLEAGLTAAAAGAMLAAAGTAFQCAFRNPIAGPEMLGVSSGIRIGNLLLVLRFSTLAASMTEERFLYGFAGGALMLLAVLLAGALAGGGRGSVTDMLLTGCVLSRVAARLASSLQYSLLDESEYLTLQQMDLYGAESPRGALFFAAALAVGLIPLLAGSGRLDLLTFSDQEARTMGRSAAGSRAAALVCAAVLLVAVQIRCGDLGMLALLVPHLGRYLFGASTRRLVAGSALLGALLMLLCRLILALLSFHPRLWVVSASMLVDLFAMPLMLLVMFRYRRGWE